ncbi:MAG: DegT/DnrJ/EryC1/StrS family aminotransferase [Patescibacteria group bacterium]
MKKRKINFNDFKKDAHIHKNEYLNSIERTVLSGWYVLGSEVLSFEKEFAKYLGVKHCIGVANGLEAIQIALMSAGIKKGDEVITTPLSAVATTLAILAVGGRPVFVDTDKDGLINPDLIEDVISKKTKAILPVHLYGQPCQTDKIKKICKDKKLMLIEDAAQAHGAKFNGKSLGTFGDAGCFSFYPTKNLGALGDGGCVVTDNSKIASTVRQIRDYGQSTKYKHTVYGLNSRLDELQAAVLKTKLKRLERENKVRVKLAEHYINSLKSTESIKILSEDKVGGNFHLFVIRTTDRDRLKEFLYSNGIETLIHYPTLIPDQPMFGDLYRNSKVPNARMMVSEILSLPCNPSMTLKDVDYVCSNVKTFLKKV